MDNNQEQPVITTDEPQLDLTSTINSTPGVSLETENSEQTQNSPDEQQVDLTLTPGITFVDNSAMQGSNQLSTEEYLQQLVQRAKDKTRFSYAFITAIVFFLVTILITIVVQSAVIANSPDGLTVEQQLSVQLYMYIAIYGISILIGAKILKEKLFKPIFTRPQKPKMAFLTVLLALGVGRLAEVAVTPLYQLVPVDTDYSSYYSSPQAMILFFISVAVVPAIFEEWLLRGFVLRHLLPNGKWTAIIVSSAIFGMMHSHPGQAVFAFALGLMLGIIYVNSGGNIWLCFIVHFLNNAVSVIQGYFVANKIEDMSYNLFTLISVYLPLAVALVILLIYTLKGKAPFFLPVGETDEDSYDLKPKEAAKIIFKNGSTYFYLAISILLMLSAAAYTAQ